MASKTIELPDIGPVTLIKRKSSRHIRLSVSSEGQVRVSLPTWLPYASGVAFAKQKTPWLQKQIKPPIILRHGMRIGKKHSLAFLRSGTGKLSVRTVNHVINVNVPRLSQANHPEAQQAALRACIRALKQEAETELPHRLRQLAKEHGFKFKSVEVKRLKTRWGSCNHRREITLNCFLMQLPWSLIDYVLLHELMHTQIMAHGPVFWQELGNYIPDLPQKRQAIREHRPSVRETFSISSMA